LDLVPTLFSDRPDSARVALEHKLEKAYQDLAKILQKFASYENIPPAARWAVILK
jgi:hypothetical protein